MELRNTDEIAIVTNEGCEYSTLGDLKEFILGPYSNIQHMLNNECEAIKVENEGLKDKIEKITSCYEYGKNDAHNRIEILEKENEGLKHKITNLESDRKIALETIDELHEEKNKWREISNQFEDMVEKYKKLTSELLG